MNRLRASWVLSLCLWACQPSTLCDPGQREMGGGCYPDSDERDSGGAPERDAASDEDAGEPPDAGSCGGDPYEGFKESCSSPADCGCHAPDCATDPLGYCTKFNCAGDASACPPGWTCLMIPPGASPDPSITHLCLAP